MAGQSYRLGRGGGSLSRAGQVAVGSAQQRASERTPPTPLFWKPKNGLDPSRKCAHFFIQGRYCVKPVSRNANVMECPETH